MTRTDISNSEDVLDVRDVIERYEDLLSNEERDDEETAEMEQLDDLLGQLRGNGGDHQWGGDWFPVTLIRDSYFQEYAQELAGEIGAIDPDASWPANCIDWEQAARELRMDYTSVEFDGVTYWYR